MPLRTLTLSACGCAFVVRCSDCRTVALIGSAFGGLIARESASGAPVRCYRIERRRFHPWFRVDDGRSSVLLANEDALIFYIDKDITLTLQHERRDLFFLHAAVVALGCRGIVFPALSGAGKSTLTLALTTHGFGYVSDELAPMDLSAMTVQPYPHAICLKAQMPAPYSVPVGTLQCGRRLHVPVEALLFRPRPGPLPVAAFMFLRRRPGGNVVRPVSAGAAAIRLLAHALNPLAHAGDGLDAAVSLSRTVPSFEIDLGDLRTAAASIAAVL
jgi:hypothetical protein